MASSFQFIAKDDGSIYQAHERLMQLASKAEARLKKRNYSLIQIVEKNEPQPKYYHDPVTPIQGFPNLTREERWLEAQFVERLQRMDRAIIADTCLNYAEAEGSRWKVSIDNGRKLCGQYDDPWDIAVQRRSTRAPGGFATRLAFNELCKTTIGACRILMGSQASGKTILSAQLAARDPAPVATLDGLYDNIEGIIDQLLHRHMPVELVYVHRDLEEALRSSMERAMLTGRTELVDSVVNRRFQFHRQLEVFYEHYRNNKDVSFKIAVNDAANDPMLDRIQWVKDVSAFLKDYPLDLSPENKARCTQRAFEILNEVYTASQSTEHPLSQFFYAKIALPGLDREHNPSTPFELACSMRRVAPQFTPNMQELNRKVSASLAPPQRGMAINQDADPGGPSQKPRIPFSSLED